MTKITISIVVYHTSYNMLAKLINQLSKNNVFEYKNLFIIDNSKNDYLRSLLLEFPDINYLFQNKNLGYGKGHNVVINNSIEFSGFHLVINPDITIENNTIDNLTQVLHENPRIGLVCPKITYESGELQYVYKLLPNPFNLIFRRFFPSFLFRKYNNKYELKNMDFNSKQIIPNLSGCFMFMRNSVLKEVGGFDERFFMYMEDVDLSRRINSKYETVYYPLVTIKHGFKKESYHNIKLTIIHIKSAFKYFNKWGWFFDKNRKKINNQTILNLS